MFSRSASMTTIAAGMGVIKSIDLDGIVYQKKGASASIKISVGYDLAGEPAYGKTATAASVADGSIEKMLMDRRDQMLKGTYVPSPSEKTPRRSTHDQNPPGIHHAPRLHQPPSLLPAQSRLLQSAVPNDPRPNPRNHQTTPILIHANPNNPPAQNKGQLLSPL